MVCNMSAQSKASDVDEKGAETGFEVIDSVENGKEVIRAIRKEKPDVILMDIRMPEMDGVVCTQIIKENYPDIASWSPKGEG